MNLVAGIRQQALEARAQALEAVKQRREATKQLVEQHRALALSKVEEHRKMVEEHRKAALQLVEDYRSAANAKAEEQRMLIGRRLGFVKEQRAIEAAQGDYEAKVMGEIPMTEDAYDSDGNSDQSVSDDEVDSKAMTLVSGNSTSSLDHKETRKLQKQQRKDLKAQKNAERKQARKDKQLQREVKKKETEEKRKETRRLKKEMSNNKKTKQNEKQTRPLAICDVARFFQPALAPVPENTIPEEPEDEFGEKRFEEISPHLTAKSSSDISKADTASTLYLNPTNPKRASTEPVDAPDPQYRFALSSDDNDDRTAIHKSQTPFLMKHQTGVYRADSEDSCQDGVSKTRTAFPMSRAATGKAQETDTSEYKFSTSSDDAEKAKVQRWQTPRPPADSAIYNDVEHTETSASASGETIYHSISEAPTQRRSSTGKRAPEVEKSSSAPMETITKSDTTLSRQVSRKPTGGGFSGSEFTATPVDTPSPTAEKPMPKVRRHKTPLQPKYLKHVMQPTVYEPEFEANVPQKIKTADYARFRDKYEHAGQNIGSGAFGAVSVVRSRRDKNSLFAVKEFRGRDKSETRMEYNKRVATEFCFASALNHPNVINTVEVLRDEGKWFQIMEFAPFDLFTAVKSQDMSGPEICCVFKQLMCGVEYLHSVGLAHRDLKLENMVLDSHGIIKIIDFGSAVVFRYPHETRILPATGFAGSEPYLAPEVLDEEEYLPAQTDLWSCAIIFCCMWNKRFPWKSPCFTDKDFRTFAAEITPEDEEERLASLNITKAQTVIFNMLDLEPEARAPARDLLQSAWLYDIDMCFLEDGHFHKKHEHVLLPPE